MVIKDTSLLHLIPGQRRKRLALALAFAGMYCCNAGTVMAEDLIVGDNSTETYENMDSPHNVDGNLILGNQFSGDGAYIITGDSLETNVNFIAGGNGAADPEGSNGYTDNYDTDGNYLDTTPNPAPNGALIIGNAGTGTFTQGSEDQIDSPDPNNMVNVAGDLVLGSQAGSQGQYTLNNGSLTVDGKLVVGGASQKDNLFTQNAGTVTITNLADGNPDYVGVGNSYHTGALFVGGGGDGIIDGGSGAYIMNGGQLSSNVIEVGHAGKGVMTQSGDSTVDAGYLWLGNAGGFAGEGQYNLNGGQLTVDNIAIADGAIGTFAMMGGIVDSTSVAVGVKNIGAFTQAGGAHNAHEVLIGTDAGGSGSYSLGGGTLTIGDGSTDRLVVGQNSQGTFMLTGGTLEINNDDLGTSAFVVGNNAYSDGTFTQSGGEVLGGRSLTIAANGGKGTYNLNTGNSPVLNTEFISLGNNSGEGIFNQQAETTNNTGSIYMGADHGTYNQFGGDLIVSGGQGTIVGTFGVGVFNQSGGTHHTDSLSLGQHADSSGTYILTGGELIVNNQMIVGHGDTNDSSELNGLVQQSGGTVTANSLFIGGVFDIDNSDPAHPIGTSNLGAGRYELSDGTVTSSSNTLVGARSQGRVLQTGGTFNAGNLTLGSDGLYSLSDGSGGYKFYSSGTYDLQGGTLNTNGTTVAMFGLGEFNQSGTTQHTVTGDLVVGAGPGMPVPDTPSGQVREGAYTLSGGNLSVSGDTIIGAGNNSFDGEPGGKGTFEQSGGASSIGGNLYLGQSGTLGNGAGAYTLSGGTAAVTGAMNIASGSKAELTGGSLTAGSLVNQGALSIASPGLLTITNAFSQDSTTGVLSLDLGTLTSSDGYWLKTGTADLDGRLEVKWGIAAPTAETQFKLIFASSGFTDLTFNQLMLPTLTGYHWELGSTTTDFSLYLKTGPSPVPVPSTMVLLGSALAALVRSRRRMQHQR